MSLDAQDKNQIAALLRKIVGPLKDEIAHLKAEHAILEKLAARAKSVQEEIDAIPGRRIFYTLSGSQPFDEDNAGLQGQPVTLKVSQDGPFVMTHYPVIMWKPTAPDNATNFGVWRPVSSWPLPDQVIDADLINISYAFADGGSQRNFQNEFVSPGLISRPDNVIPLPVPTLFTPNSVITVTPFYESILFNGGTPPTDGVLKVDLPGYRIANL